MTRLTQREVSLVDPPGHHVSYEGHGEKNVVPTGCVQLFFLNSTIHSSIEGGTGGTVRESSLKNRGEMVSLPSPMPPQDTEGQGRLPAPLPPGRSPTPEDDR